jgi:hypothetical protein
MADAGTAMPLPQECVQPRLVGARLASVGVAGNRSRPSALALLSSDSRAVLVRVRPHSAHGAGSPRPGRSPSGRTTREYPRFREWSVVRADVVR